MNLRNPARTYRAALVAGAYSAPGAIMGLMVGLLLPYPRTLFVSGLLAGIMAGLWIELRC